MGKENFMRTGIMGGGVKSPYASAAFDQQANAMRPSEVVAPDRTILDQHLGCLMEIGDALESISVQMHDRLNTLMGSGAPDSVDDRAEAVPHCTVAELNIQSVRLDRIQVRLALALGRLNQL